MRVKGTTVLLSGASGGIGQALARGFKAAGANLILTGRRADVLDALSTELRAKAIVADLSRSDDTERMIAKAGPVDIVVLNAAVPAGGRLCDVSLTGVDEAIAVNLRAPIAMARGFVPMMKQKGAGHIVFIGSAGSRVTAANSAVYHATKFGLRGFALALRQDLHSVGVGVSIVEPVFVREVGMFADSGLAIPPGMRTSSPQRVVRVVLRVIRRNKAEAIVAPLDLRVALTLGAMAPELSARAGRLMGIGLQPKSIDERKGRQE